MDEYYCPKCGAVLNEQDGFDPDAGTWRCTECGEMLMDEDIYNGDTFQGVAWYCDNCGALLNRQCGFSDRFGIWSCSECGYQNGITENDIVHDNPEFLCPNCGIALDYQPEFDKYDENWVCTKCNIHLHHDYSDEEYSIMKYICPNCGAPLDIQLNFDKYVDDWVCSECGTHLHHDYSDDDYEEIEECDETSDEELEEDDIDHEYLCPNCGMTLNYQPDFDKYDNDYECTECGTHLHHDYYDDDYEEIEDCDEENDEELEEDDTDYSFFSKSSSTYDNVTHDNASEKSAYNFKKKIGKKIKIFCIILMAIALLVGFAYYEIKLLIPVGYSSSELVGNDYKDVMTLLEKRGFTHVKNNEIADLTSKQISQENKVTSIKIGFDENFYANSKFPSNFPVTITFHTLQYLTIPVSSKEIKGINYQEVETSFRNAGFENINMEVEYDIITGWLVKDGETKSVTINGDKKFSVGDEYHADAEIVIAYHTYRKNKPKQGD